MFFSVSLRLPDFQVEDLNDNPPQLNAVAYEGTIRENALPGTTIRVLPAIQVVITLGLVWIVSYMHIEFDFW